MDFEKRVNLIESVGEEIITREELRNLLQTKTHPTAYDGFEPSGLAHLPFGVFRPLLLKDLIKAGVKFKLFLADWHAWVNNKMGGDLEKIRTAGEYFIEVWRAAGIERNKVEFIWATDIFDQEYWKKVILIAKNTTVNRATRALSIMGRKKGEMKETAQYFYPMMQVADIFQLDVDICQLGLDQRRANMLAREIASKFGRKKPIVVSHHMLMGLEGKKVPEGFETNERMDIEISSKMSKSKPSTCIYIHDSRERIKEKIHQAFCAPKVVDNNPMLDYSKHIIFRAFEEMEIERARKFGGTITFESYNELEQSFRKGEIHPLDLKGSVAKYLDQLIKPLREHFEKDRRAKSLLEKVRKFEITR
jgi:tyrosyl-tRNA synthetase